MNLIELDNKKTIEVLQMQVEKLNGVIDKFQKKSATDNELMLVRCSLEVMTSLMNMRDRLKLQSVEIE
jgi:hypothetical protein